MIIELESHKGLKMVDPIVEVQSTLDNPINETFTPSVLFIYGENIQIWHELPSQPYVNGTWEDADVQNAINKYLAKIDLDK